MAYLYLLPTAKTTTVAAQPSIAVDRFAREVVQFLRALSSALAAPECGACLAKPWQVMKKIPINAIEMVRRIRDAHHEQLRGKSPEERIAFYRAKARLLQAQIETLRQQQPVNESQ